MSSIKPKRFCWLLLVVAVQVATSMNPLYSEEHAEYEDLMRARRSRSSSSSSSSNSDSRSSARGGASSVDASASRDYRGVGAITGHSKSNDVLEVLHQLHDQIHEQIVDPDVAEMQQQQQQQQQQGEPDYEFAGPNVPEDELMQEDDPQVVLMDQQFQQFQQRQQELMYKHLMKFESRDKSENYEYVGGKKPVITYAVGNSEADLPLCKERSDVCNKVDVYGEPWIERQCRCPGGRSCSKSMNSNDGHTIVDKTRHFKLCEPIRRLPTCRFFRDAAITITPMSAPRNGSTYKVNCKCKPGSVTYLLTRKIHERYPVNENQKVSFRFGCSPQSTSRIRCLKKQPCRLFTQHFTDRSYPGFEMTTTKLCDCPRGHHCPRYHNDFGSLFTSYFGKDTRLYNGHCMPNVFLPYDQAGQTGSKKQQKQQMYSLVN